MKKTKVDYNILNALYLTCTSLGDAFLDTGYNPYPKNFVLTSEYVEKLLQNAKQKDTINIEDFLENNNQEIAKNFEISLHNNTQILEEMLKVKEKNTQLDLIIVFLKNRKELLKQAINKLQSDEVVALDLYRDIFALDYEYSEVMKQTYYQNFNNQIVIQNFLNMCFGLNQSSKYIPLIKEETINGKEDLEKKIQQKQKEQKQEKTENLKKEEDKGQQKEKSSLKQSKSVSKHPSSKTQSKEIDMEMGQ